MFNSIQTSYFYSHAIMFCHVVQPALTECESHVWCSDVDSGNDSFVKTINAQCISNSSSRKRGDHSNLTGLLKAITLEQGFGATVKSQFSPGLDCI